MTRLPYGFDPAPETLDDDPWSKLCTINEYLSDCEPIPPHLAHWLGLAIQYSDGDPAEFMRRLGLKRRPGRQPHKHAAKAWLEWGECVCQREDNGERPEAAIDAVLSEYSRMHPEGVSRTQLQKWRDDYRQASIEARCRQ